MPDVRQRHSSSSGVSEISRASKAVYRPTGPTQPPTDRDSRTSSAGRLTLPPGSSALRLPPTVRHSRARPGSLLSVSCRPGPSSLVGTRGERFVPAGPCPRLAVPVPTAGSLAHLNAVVAIASVPPVLHGGSAAPPASPPRGTHSEVRASLAASSVPHVATAIRASSSHSSSFPESRQPERPGCHPVRSGFSL